MKKEPAESVLVETQPDLVGIVALSKGREGVSPWANPGLAWLLSAEAYILGWSAKRG